MCNSKRNLGVHKNALGRDTTCMKDRYFIMIHIYWFSPFRHVNIIDPNRRCRPYGYRSTMSMCILWSNFNLYWKATIRQWVTMVLQWEALLLKWHKNTDRLQLGICYSTTDTGWKKLLTCFEICKAGIGFMLTTILPFKDPAERHFRLVLYIGTFLPCWALFSGIPAFINSPS